MLRCRHGIQSWGVVERLRSGRHRGSRTRCTPCWSASALAPASWCSPPPPPILLPLSSPVLACRISAWGVREREARVGTWSAETKGECVSKRRAGTGHEKSSRGTFLRLCTAHPILSDSSPPVSTTLKHAGTICGTSPGTSAGRPLRAGNLCTTAQLPAWLGGAGQPAGGQQHQGP